MAEIASRQKAKLDAGGLVTGAEGLGKVRALTITTPATHDLENGDTMASGVLIPKDARILGIFEVSSGAVTGVNIDLGLRNFDTKEVIDLDGLFDGYSIGTAGTNIVPTANIGALIDDGAEYLVPERAEAYITVTTGNPDANDQFRVTLFIVTND